MSAVSSPFGFKPVTPQGEIMRLQQHGAKNGWNGIASGYASSIYVGTPVVVATADGSLQVAGTTGAIYGIFQGCEYLDSSGRFIQSRNWIAGTVATQVVAYIYRADADYQYLVQANGSLTGAAIGDQANCVNPGTGSLVLGTSTAGLSTTLAGAGVTAQFAIVGFSGSPYDTPGDAFTNVIVRINQSQPGPGSAVAV